MANGIVFGLGQPHPKADDWPGRRSSAIDRPYGFVIMPGEIGHPEEHEPEDETTSDFFSLDLGSGNIASFFYFL